MTKKSVKSKTRKYSNNSNSFSNVVIVVLVVLAVFVALPLFSSHSSEPLSIGNLLLIDPGTDSPDDPGLEVFNTKEFFEKLPLIKARIRTIKERYEKDLPYIVRLIVGYENANIYVNLDDGSQKHFSLKLEDSIESINSLRLAEPTINICIDEKTFDDLLSERIAADEVFAKGLIDGKIQMEGFDLLSDAKVRALTTLITFELDRVIVKGDCGPKGILKFEKVIPIDDYQNFELRDYNNKPLKANLSIVDPENVEKVLETSEDGTATVQAVKLGWHDVKALDNEVVLDFERFLVVDLGALNVFGASGFLIDSINTLEALDLGLMVLLLVVTIGSGFVVQNRSQILFEGKQMSSREENLTRTYRTILGAVAFAIPWGIALLFLGSIGVVTAIVEIALVLIAYTVIKRQRKLEKFKAVKV